MQKIYDKDAKLEPRMVSDAIRRNTSMWAIDNTNFKDPLIFISKVRRHVEKLVNDTDSIGKKVKTVLVCEMVRTDIETGRNTYTIAYFNSRTHSIISDEDMDIAYNQMRDKMLESLAKYLVLGSGWRLHSIDSLDIQITKYRPLNGRSYKPLPKEVAPRKAVINMKNDDNQCFKWSITRALNPVERDAERVTKTLKEQAKKLNWNGVRFPTTLRDISKFESNNKISVNVYSYDDDEKEVYTLKVSKSSESHKQHVNLFLYDEHYSVVKNLSRLVSSQLSKIRQRNTSVLGV